MPKRLLNFLKPRTATGWLKRLTLLGAIVAVGWYGTGLYMSMAHALGQTNPIQLAAGLASTDLKQTNGRTNILIAGYSADDAGHSGANLTDSIMVVSV